MTFEPDEDALRGAAGRVRELIAHLRKTRAPQALLDEVAGTVAALNAKLGAHDHPGPYMQAGLDPSTFGERMRGTDDPPEFFPYSPVVGPRNPLAPPVSFRFDGEEMRASHVFDAPYCGPPASVHGGVIALVFDELLGCLGAMRNIGGFTGTLTIVYRSLTPLGQPIRMRGWVDRVDGVKVYIKGTMHTKDAPREGEERAPAERLCAEAEGIFIRPKTSVFEDAMTRSGQLPPNTKA